MGDGPRFEVSTVAAAKVRVDLLVIPMFDGPALGPEGVAIQEALGTHALDTLRRNGIRGRSGEVFAIEGHGTSGSRRVLLVGVERGDEIGAIREVAMRAGSISRTYRTIATTVTTLGSDATAAASAFVEGFLLGGYRFDRHRSDAEPARTATVKLLVDHADREATKRGMQRGVVVGSATNWARDLTNAPASESTPVQLADEANAMADQLGLTSKIWGRRQLERGAFGGIVGIGAGSANEPRLVELAFRGAGRERPIALTGKGVTFDSGGLNVKRPSEMAWMRSDMAGGAAALATVRAVAELGLPVNLIAAVPFAENMPGGSAIRPGDVVHHRGGRTSEVLDTDAEGRVMLADALSYLCERPIVALLDSATLTDASGLGPDLWAAMGTDPALMSEMLTSGTEAGEPGWEIPLWARYRPTIDSTVADVKNIGDHEADSAMLAGLFLKEFVADGVPWVHLDTGSSAWAEHATDLWPEGATGAPTRAFVRLIERLGGGA